MLEKTKSKIKSFFTISDEDLKEEHSKVFEKVKLFTLTRTNLFLAITAFFIIINALIISNLDIIYLRQILGFLFIITIPGLLLMLCFKIREVKFWEYLVYTIGLSITFIMFAGLAVNWILPFLGITDKPLSLWPILICFDVFLIALGFVAWRRNIDLKPFDITTPKLDLINNIFFIVPMILPVLSVLGAFILNNHGSNILTVIMFSIIAAYSFLLTIFRRKINGGIWPWALFLIALSLILIVTMRGNYVINSDPGYEYQIFKITSQNYLWAINPAGSIAYESMLSISILPVCINLFLGFVNAFLIFKLIFPFFFSLIPVIIYLLIKKLKISSVIAFFSSFLFLSYMGVISANRQWIAFLFFGLMLLIFFIDSINLIIKKMLFTLFGFSMIVSHYSTAYIALSLFTLTYFITFLYRKRENKKIKIGQLNPPKKTDFYLTGILIILLLLFGFLWYNQVTSTANGLVNFAHQSISNFGNIFNEDTNAEGTSVLQQFNILYTPNINNLLQQNLNETLKNQNISQVDNYQNGIYLYTPSLSYISLSNYNIPYKYVSLFYIIFNIMGDIIKILIILGVFLLLFNKIVNSKFSLEYNFLIFISIVIMIAVIIIPYASLEYSSTRTLQQLLILLTLPTLVGFVFFLKVLKVKKISFIISIFFILYLLFSFGMIQQILGGNDSAIFNNIGKSYETSYIHVSEASSASWLDINNISKIIYTDQRGKSKISPFLTTYTIPINNNFLILPSLIVKDTYVYFGYTNEIYNRGFTMNRLYLIPYNLPTQFLNNNKNKIYNNGGSEIFK